MSESTEGKKMFVESLLTKEEWNRNMRKYPNTNNMKYDEANKGATNSFKWRFRMGETLTSLEIGNINRNLDYLLKRVKKCTT